MKIDINGETVHKDDGPNSYALKAYLMTILNYTTVQQLTTLAAQGTSYKEQLLYCPHIYNCFRVLR